MNRSGIPYLTHSWSPVTGCSPVSEGCANCWSRGMAHRFVRSFEPTFHPGLLDKPLRLRKPSVIGVCFNGDLFHERIPDAQIRHVVAVMADESAEKHTFIVLTKRPERARSILTSPLSMPNDWPTNGLHNVWLGVSVENQARADERIPILLETPAAHRWVSLEPQIGPVDLSRWLYEERYHECCGRGGSEGRCCGDSERTRPGLDWVVQGCESGPCRRPFDLTWARSVRDQCKSAGVPYYLKQVPWWAPLRTCDTEKIVEKPTLDGRQHLDLPWAAVEGGR